MKLCKIKDCDKTHLALGFCISHYAKFRKYGDPLHIFKRVIRYCSVLDCKNIYFSRGYCSLHYNKMIRNNNPPCKIEGCNQPRIGRGYCSMHYQRLKLNGDPEKTQININPPKTCQIEGCNKPHSGKGMCQAHYMKKYNEERRKLVISHYTNGATTCQCCGEVEYIFLDIDHTNDDGAQHRKEIGSSFKLIDWIIRNNFPSGFRVLCSNCNVGRYRNGGVCPHESLNTV